MHEKGIKYTEEDMRMKFKIYNDEELIKVELTSYFPEFNLLREIPGIIYENSKREALFPRTSLNQVLKVFADSNCLYEVLPIKDIKQQQQPSVVRRLFGSFDETDKNNE